MAIQWMDDFTGYGTDSSRLTRILNGAWAETAWFDLTADPDGVSTGYVANVQSNTSSMLRRTLNSAQTTVGIAQRVWLTNLPPDVTTVPYLGHFSDLNNNLHVYFYVNPSGYIVAMRNDNAGAVQLGITSGPVVIANGWRHYEIKVVLSNTTTGSVEVRIEGVTVLSVTGIRTASDKAGYTASISNVYWRNARQISVGPSMYLKDVIVWDGTGTRNNDFMGSCQVYKIIPQSDVSLGWTPNTGTTGYNLINETSPDDDTGYINAPYPVPSPSTFNMTDLPVNVTSVRGVQVIHRSKKTDGGDGNVQTRVITTGGNSDGSDRTISTAYTYWSDVFDAAPGATNWNKTLVDGMTLRINRTL